MNITKTAFYGFKLFTLLILLSVLGQLNAKNSEILLPHISYLSPKPGSVGISVSTNLIFRFDKPILNMQQLEKALSIWNRENKIEYDLVSQPDPLKLIVKPRTSLPYGSEIRVLIKTAKLLTGLGDESAIIYSFKTQKQTDLKSYINEDWLQNKSTALPTQNGTAALGEKITNDFINGIPFEMVTSAGNPNDYFFTSTMLSPFNNDRLMIINGQGKLVFDKPTPFNALDFKMHDDSTFSYALLDTDPDKYSFVVLDKNFKAIDTVRAGNGYITDIHELVKDKKSGNHFLLAQRIVTVNMRDIMGYGSTEAKILDLIIQEINANGDVLFEWKCLDHLPVSDAQGVNLTSLGVIDYVHCNGIMLDSDTTLLLSSRHLSEVTRIDRRTGEIIWRLGTRASSHQFNFTNDIDGFSYLHHAQKLKNGHILLFDNGNFRPGERYSRVVEYEIDEKLMRATMVWEYRNTPDVITNFMGSVQRLENGNTVIGWGSGAPSFTEVDSTGKVIYEGALPANVLNYRTFKYQIPDLISRLQPKLNLPKNFEICQLKDPEFSNKVYRLIAPFIDKNISGNYQLYNLDKNVLELTLKDSASNFLSYYKQPLNFKKIGLMERDTTICVAGTNIILNIEDNCIQSSYLWSTNETTKAIDFKTKPNFNKAWVTIKNGEMTQTDSIAIKVTPLEQFEIIGETNPMKAFQILTYSVPYYKGVTYEWKPVNGNLIAGYETNSVQIQWGNKPTGKLMVTIIDPFGCSVSFKYDTINILPKVTGYDELRLNTDLKVYPSPFNEWVNLESLHAYKYKLMSLTGNVIEEISSEMSGLKTIQTQNLASGIYLMEITLENEVYRIKISKD
ncbi:MAG: aryl-sulfate sulfotransferase [bacterium]|nr:aryl-sulfate sulfotransferase [bacterium]